MLLFKKILPMIILSITLSACGGGGDSGNSNHTSSTTHSNKYSNVNTSYYYLDSSSENSSSYSYYKEIKYIDGLTPSDTNYYTSLSNEEFILTPKGLFTNDFITSVTKAKSETQLYFSLASGSGYIDNLEKIDISSQNIVDTIYAQFIPYYINSPNLDYPENYEFYNIFNGFGYYDWISNSSLNYKFPQNSICYRIESRESEQDYFEFTTQDVLGLNYNDFIIATDAGIKQNKELFFTKTSGEWSGYHWTRYDVSDADGKLVNYAIIEYQAKAYLAEIKGYSYNAKEQINTLKSRLKNNSLSDIENIKIQTAIATLEDSCDYYNKTAIDAISNSAELYIPAY